MEMQVPEEFVKLLRETGWGPREIGRRADLSHTLISNIMNLGEQPSFDTCVALAPILGKSPVTLIYMAGLLPKPPDWTPDMEETRSILSRLSEEDRRAMMAFAKEKLKPGESERERTG
jgi:transcriptional regulator with XRE-family HTH domain